MEEALFTWKETSADFAGYLIGAKTRRVGCRATATFDLRATKLAGFVAA
jgi:predicted nucleic-acid-binding protein